METLQFYDYLSPSEKIIAATVVIWIALTLVVPLALKLFLLIKTGTTVVDKTSILYLTFVVSVWLGLFLVSCLKYQAYGRGAEAYNNLGRIYQLQAQYFGEHNTYAGRRGHNGTGCFSDLKWKPKSDSIFSYYCGGDQVPRAYPKTGTNYDPDSNWPVDVKPMSTKTGFTIMAIGNIDQDPDIEVWMMNDSKTLLNLSYDFIDGRGPQLLYLHLNLLKKDPIILSPYLIALAITPLLFVSLFIDYRRYRSSAGKDH